MPTLPSDIKQVFVVGAGGVASYLLPVLFKLLNGQESPPVVTLIDGDKLETKNLDRQLFREDQIGKFKGEALVELYRPSYKGDLNSIDRFFMEGIDGIIRNSLWLVCVDNHAARKAVLATVDSMGGRAIFGTNEYTDAEAYCYEPAWMGGPLDPRTYYPVILTDDRDDPTRPTSCQGEASIASPQLVLANSSAANFMLWLLWFHYIERPQLDSATTSEVWPHLHRNNFSRFSTTLTGETKKAHEARR